MFNMDGENCTGGVKEKRQYQIFVGAMSACRTRSWVRKEICDMTNLEPSKSLVKDPAWGCVSGRREQELYMDI
jgi:hypothetical protein